MNSDNNQNTAEYQKILDQYSSLIDQNPKPNEPVQTSASAPAPPPVSQTPNSSLPPLPLLEPNRQQLETTASHPSPVSGSTPSFLKVVFYFSLFLFLTIASLVGYSFYQKFTKLPGPAPSPISTPTPNNPEANSPPPSADQTGCLVNDQSYNFGQTFPASDGCNTCTCNELGQVTCTLMACSSTLTPAPGQN